MSPAAAGETPSGGAGPGGARRTPSRARTTPEERTAMVEAYLASGQSQRDFAAEHDVPYSTLSAWVREVHGPRR